MKRMWPCTRSMSFSTSPDGHGVETLEEARRVARSLLDR